MNRRRLGAVALAALMALMALGSIDVRAGHAQAQPPGPCGMLTVSDPDVVIQVDAPQQFVIVLESNPTTGYSWEMAEAPDADEVQFVGKEYVSGGAGRPGAGGVECWTFEAVGPGETAIGMIYHRPFDPPETAPARTASFTIDVSQTFAGPDAPAEGDTDFGAVSGEWSRRGFDLTINADGSGTASWRTYRWCADDPTPGCDSMDGDRIVPGGQATLVFSRVDGTTARGRVAASNDERTLSLGPASFLVLEFGIAVLSQGSSAMVVCGPAFEQAPAPVVEAAPCGV